MALPTRVSRVPEQVDPYREFDAMLNRFLGGMGDGGSQRLAPYAVDVREDADHFYVDAELPGFKKEDIDITLENQMLMITAQRSESEKKGEQPKGDFLLNERRFSRFQRMFTLPPTVDERNVDAKLSDGVLHIVLNKREESKPKKIQVS